ncbi:MAG TPA: hypothetical protein ENI87_11435 [bacterium]|nr:hypothetical protein [bacterium]
MRPIPPLTLCLLLAACGGGGGGNSAPSAGSSPSFEVAPATIAAGSDETELAFAVGSGFAATPVLLEAHFHLPPQLRVPVQDPLVASSSLVTLDGEARADGFLVVCGDAVNPEPSPLPIGELFRLRVQAGQPRQPGTYAITVDGLRASTANGDPVPLGSDSFTVNVTVE